VKPDVPEEATTMTKFRLRRHMLRHLDRAAKVTASHGPDASKAHWHRAEAARIGARLARTKALPESRSCVCGVAARTCCQRRRTSALLPAS
jgi:hypothetical protein